MNEVWIPIDEIDLRATLIDSAQCFCWREEEDGFLAALDDGRGTAAFCLTEAPGGVRVSCERPTDAEFWSAYLDVERDYAELAERYGWHEQMAAALRAARGLRVLRQGAWDALLSFILSANNNVGRITSLVEKLSRRYGRRADWKGIALYAVPTAGELRAASEADLRALGCGYRAPYLAQAAARVADGFDLDGLRRVPYAQAHAALTSFMGVGDKVADCVCLFGLQHTCAFPVDVWVERLLVAWFGMEGLSRKEMARRASELLGDEAGLIQQYLFHCARLGLLGELSTPRARGAKR